MKKLLSLLIALSLLIGFAGCSDDDDDNPVSGNDTEVWVGTWLSADANVAPILQTVFNYDSVRVEFTKDQVVRTHSHVKDGAWTTTEGIYKITESEDGDVHKVELSYDAFDQEGIIQFIDGNPMKMKLEAVQVRPNIGATPRTPETGFGSDATLGTANIQNYVKID